MLYTVENGHDTFKDQDESDVRWRIANVRNGESLVITPQSPLTDYIVFYGGERRSDATGWMGWNQSRQVKARSHREAVIAYLYCNHSPGTRYGVVGVEHGHPNQGSQVLRHFKLVEAGLGEVDYEYKGDHSSGPLRVEEINL